MSNVQVQLGGNSVQVQVQSSGFARANAAVTLAAASAAAAAASAAQAVVTLSTAVLKANNLSDLTSASTARTNLGVAIGTNVQAFSANLDEYAAVNPTAAGLALLDDADASAQRTTLGLGTIATQAASNVAITGGSVTGITDLAVADGGTGASSAAVARANLGVGIGTDVQAYDPDLSAIAALTSAADKAPYATGAGTWALADQTAFARTLMDDADAGTARTTLAAVGTAELAASTGAALVGSIASGTGAVARTLQAAYRDQVVSVLEYFDAGVTPGAQNDTVAVQKALTTGKSIFIPAGVNCRIDTTLTTGGAGQRIYGPGSITHTPNATICLTVAHENCVVSGLKIISQGAHDTTNVDPTFAVIWVSANGAAILNNIISKVPKVGVALRDAGRALVWGNQIDGEITSYTGVGHFGIMVDGGTGDADGQNVISHNFLRRGTSGVFVGNYGSGGDQPNNHITDNVFHSMWDHGVYMNGSTGSSICDNNFYNCTAPIVARGYGLVVTGNTLLSTGTTRTAGVTMSVRDARRCVIANNTIRGNCDNAGTGAVIDVTNISESELSDNIIANNIIEQTGSTGVFAIRVGSSTYTETSYGNVVRGNRIKGAGPQFDGLISFRMKATFTGYNNEIADNLIYVSTDSYAIFISAQRLAKIRNNQMRFEYTSGIAYTGIFAWLDASNDSLVTGNEFAILGAGTNVAARALQVNDCARTRASDNVLVLDSASTATLSGLTEAGTTANTVSLRNSWNLLEVSAAQNLASIADGDSLSTDFFLAGVATGGAYWVSAVWASDTLSGCSLTAYVKAADTVTFTVTNTTGAAVDLPNLTYYIQVTKRI